MSYKHTQKHITGGSHMDANTVYEMVMGTITEDEISEGSRMSF